ncbi:MAG: glycosyltransferase family 2 protein [Verrucomicrobia bacterium]|nr:glycosyltransferase family 2 protein [Verrucomicrobiota bacterium]
MFRRLPKLLILTSLALITIFLAAFKFRDAPLQKEPSQSANASGEKAIVVVIPSYNNKEWYQRNLDSVLSQNYHNFRVIYIDDASPDGTGNLVKAYIKKKNEQKRVTLVQNSKRIGALGNVYKGIWMCAPDEIVANLDGDDWFKDENVLAKLNQVYSDPNVWVTYGQFVYYPCGTPGWAAEVPPEIIEQNAFRDYKWVTTALRTFYAGLFHKIKIDDLLYNGEFFRMAGDLAYMWPILEMAGIHSRFIPDVLYVYNVDTPINDIKTDPTHQLNLGFETRAKPRYSPIDRPYD